MCTAVRLPRIPRTFHRTMHAFTSDREQYIVLQYIGIVWRVVEVQRATYNVQLYFPLRDGRVVFREMYGTFHGTGKYFLHAKLDYGGLFFPKIMYLVFLTSNSHSSPTNVGGYTQSLPPHVGWLWRYVRYQFRHLSHFRTFQR